ncbi:hypothetical protein TrRE_jg1215, partial [Triparma retinervis]
MKPTERVYVAPQIAGKVEESIEGLSEDDFPPDLSWYFNFQHLFFVIVYMALSLRILCQVIVAEHLHNCFQMNRHFITLFVFLGCVLRSYYIFTVDFTDNIPGATEGSRRAFSYGLRCVNDVFWFASFSYLGFFWYEVQTCMRRGVTKVTAMKAKMHKCIAGFAAIRAARAACEMTDAKAGVLAGKGGVAVYCIGLGVFVE